MSKQSDAKRVQQYVPKAVPTTCMNCQRMKFDMALPLWMRGNPEHDKPQNYGQVNLRCEIGGFAVKRMATCAMFTRKPVTSSIDSLAK